MMDDGNERAEQRQVQAWGILSGGRNFEIRSMTTQRPNPRELGAVLGPVKAWPGNG